MDPNTWTKERLEEVRQTAAQVLERAKTDEDFRAQIQKDPVGTLTGAGLPEEAVGNFLRDSQLFDDPSEVEGYFFVCVGTFA